VLSINYTLSHFWVVDTNLGMQNSCPLPRWDHRDDYYYYSYRSIELAPGGNSHRSIELAHPGYWAIFMNCSQEIKYSGSSVKCLSTADSFIYVSISPSYSVPADYFAPSCGFLARTPWGGPEMLVSRNASYLDDNAFEGLSYLDVIKVMREGFALRFPFTYGKNFRECLAWSTKRYLIITRRVKAFIWFVPM
jgi:hypothetical protein